MPIEADFTYLLALLMLRRARWGAGRGELDEFDKQATMLRDNATCFLWAMSRYKRLRSMSPCDK